MSESACPRIRVSSGLRAYLRLQPVFRASPIGLLARSALQGGPTFEADHSSLLLSDQAGTDRDRQCLADPRLGVLRQRSFNDARRAVLPDFAPARD